MKRLANLDAVTISGKPYVMVDKRIAHSASNFDYDVKIKKVKYYSEIKTWTVHIKLKIRFDQSKDHYNSYDGIAQEVIGDGFINKASALENAYTSALGKAFTAAGIGIQHGTASGDEIEKAQAQTNSIDDGFNSILERLEDWKNKYPEWTTFIGFAKDHYRLSNKQVSQLAKLWTQKKNLDYTVADSIPHYIDKGMSFDTFINNVKEGYNVCQFDEDVLALRWNTNKIAS